MIQQIQRIPSKNKKNNILILGAGSWGGTLAYVLSKKNHNITIWTPDVNEYNALRKTRTLLKPKKVKLSKHIKIINNLSKSTKKQNIIIIAVPTSVFKNVTLKLKKENINKNIILLSASKGIIKKENIRPSKLLEKLFPNNYVAVLSGPNIALDVLSKTPIISVIACRNLKIAKLLQNIISSKYFRVYINKDIVGVEIAGALKNVIAIASGISDGFGFSISTKAALISRGLIEVAKIALCEGANVKTLLGAAGIGDLIATCCSTNSRNYKVGFQIAKNKKLTDILKDLKQTAEGVETVRSMVKLGKKYKIDVPIANSVYDIVIKQKKPSYVLNNLLKRPLTNYELEF